MADDRLCLLSVHAHPDDESSKGASTVARYASERVRTVLVCCTGGEEGDILNPAMERPEVRERLPEIRMEELARAAEIIGYEHVELLGYRDSGMAGTPSNDDPRCFAKAPEDEAVARLVRIFRQYKPDVVLTYGDKQEFYPHPDHLRVHDVTVAAFAASGDPHAYPDAGEPWEPSKLYYSVLSFGWLRKMFEAFQEAGWEWPWPDRWDEVPNHDDLITTRVDVAQWAHVRTEALRAHATQIDPESPFWFGLTGGKERDFYGEEDYVLARSRVETTLPEDDLFAGLRSPAAP